MDDCDRLLRLIKGGYSCISIVTHEEQYALEIVRLAALNMSRPLWLWSMTSGVRDGLLADSPSIAETELPATGLRQLMDVDPGSICVTLDLAEHLKGLALRMLRDAAPVGGSLVHRLRAVGTTDELPDPATARWAASFLGADVQDWGSTNAPG